MASVHPELAETSPVAGTLTQAPPTLWWSNRSCGGAFCLSTCCLQREWERELFLTSTLFWAARPLHISSCWLVPANVSVSLWSHPAWMPVCLTSPQHHHGKHQDEVEMSVPLSEPSSPVFRSSVVPWNSAPPQPHLSPSSCLSLGYQATGKTPGGGCSRPELASACRTRTQSFNLFFILLLESPTNPSISFTWSRPQELITSPHHPVLQPLHQLPVKSRQNLKESCMHVRPPMNRSTCSTRLWLHLTTCTLNRSNFPHRSIKYFRSWPFSSLF